MKFYVAFKNTYFKVKKSLYSWFAKKIFLSWLDIKFYQILFCS